MHALSDQAKYGTYNDRHSSGAKVQLVSSMYVVTLCFINITLLSKSG